MSLGDEGILSAAVSNNYSVAYFGSTYLGSAMRNANVSYAYLQSDSGGFVNITASTVSSFTYPLVTYDYANVSSLQNSSIFDYNVRTFLGWTLNISRGKNPSAIFDSLGYVPLPQNGSQTSFFLTDRIK